MHFWGMWRMNTVPNKDDYASLSQKDYRVAISSPPPWLQNLLNLDFMHMICPAIMKNTECLEMWLEWHLKEGIVQHARWQPQGFIPTHHLKHLGTGAKLIHIWMIATPNVWWFTAHLGYHISPIGGANRRKPPQSTPISLEWRTTYSLSYLIQSEWSPVASLGMTFAAGGRQKPQPRHYAKNHN